MLVNLPIVGRLCGPTLARIPRCGGCMSLTYEICGSLSVRGNFRHYHAQQFARSIAEPADIYFATDAVTRSLVIRIRGALTDDEMKSVDGALEQFSQKWAQTGAIFRRVRYGEVSFVPVGFALHAELLQKLIDEQTQLEALLQRQARILEKFRPTAS
ncbi:hypothetical protein A8F72_14980 [Burkholderia cenocepacia]|nr:hypothetical protein A8F32_23795 [Burkholderia cenocepacia]ONI93673.1 hypothetical protein A8F53_25140 [Burkholderia cenocepacia]ONJ09936.1 hypothetical protein A8F33_06150 [Burkholderia cenocepacia]ONJ28731.1 hypothetical protein A8F38_20865 [Burkholderia cenocepacia]ONY63903.1 hypothetical protein A8F35_31560 [Burkholderia cenocepacia]